MLPSTVVKDSVFMRKGNSDLGSLWFPNDSKSCRLTKFREHSEESTGANLLATKPEFLELSLHSLKPLLDQAARIIRAVYLSRPYSSGLPNLRLA